MKHDAFRMVTHPLVNTHAERTIKKTGYPKLRQPVFMYFNCYF